MKFTNILGISDLQLPFEHRDAFDFVCHVDKTYFPDGKRAVLNLGDEVDQHTMGKWPANPNGKSGGDEFEEAKLRLQPWFKKFPRTKICISNHTYRAWKKAFQNGIPRQFMKEIGEAYEAPPGWLWAERWVIDDIICEHGEHVSGPTAARLAAEQNRMKTIIGHQHTFGGVVYSGSFHDEIWGLNSGCLIDVEQYAFDYGKPLRKKPTLGMAVVKDGVPYFIPMLLGQNKRWLRRI